MQSKTLVRILSELNSLATAARGEEGCGKDIECKGERICVQRQCVDPETRPPPPPEEHASLNAPPAPIPGASSPMAQLDATRHRHLGFFIRPDLGVGYLSTKASQGAGDHWGLGVVAHLSTSFNKDSGSNAPTWSSWSGTIAFTATYN